MLRHTLVLVLVGLAGGTARGQTLELRSGEVLVGRVLSVDEREVGIQVGYPTAAVQRVPRDDIAPRSLFELLAARADHDDPKAHMALAETAQKLGLPAHAIAEYREAARLDAGLQQVGQEKVDSLRAGVADALLVEAREALDDGHWPEAKLTAEVVLDRYADTPAAKAAKDLVTRALAMHRSETAAAPASSPRTERVLDVVRKREEEVARLGLGTSGGIGATVKEQKVRERAVAQLEAAWQALESIGGEPQGELLQARDRVRDALREHYIALATTFLQRRAVSMAEKLNAKACALDPENGGCHHLQDLIIQARLTSGYR